MEDKDKTEVGSDRIYWNEKTQAYQTEFPNKRDRIVYMMGDSGMTLREAEVLKNLVAEELESMSVSGNQRGKKPLQRFLQKLDESIYFSQRY